MPAVLHSLMSVGDLFESRRRDRPLRPRARAQEADRRQLSRLLRARRERARSRAAEQ